MSLELVVKKQRWLTHQEKIHAQFPALVPVVKGNGYGFGMSALTEAANHLGCDLLAVGTVEEIAQVRAAGWPKKILLLAGAHQLFAEHPELAGDENLIVTVSSLAELETAIVKSPPHSKILVEVMTSLGRTGISPSQLEEAARILAQSKVDFAGWSLHFPMRRKNNYSDAKQLANAALAIKAAPVWLSHLSADDYAKLRGEIAEKHQVETHIRIGTKLWLGDPKSYQVQAEVMAIRPVSAGSRVGYWQNKIRKNGYVVVLSGGTANGVSVAAPSPAASWRQILITLAEAFLTIFHRNCSPYALTSGVKSHLIEPPHMQCCLLFADKDPGLAVGDKVAVNVRITTAKFDAVRFE